MSKLSKHVGIKIRNLRKNRGLTQEQLGELVDLPQSYIGGIERGEKNISLETLERIVRTLRVDPSNLFSGYDLTNSQYERSKLLDSTHLLIEQCSDKELTLIKKLVEVVISEAKN
ncbi:helix-turn-helix domain-containing protein [Paenibacillus sp. HWE-109]|uniref:helix-turn-helix domain-containing protein n=1 Tax=Paenibacillus sp. HWE-109 TaxID=1306526 RepID=UPI001EE000A1|nr:helix-turn-helix transcriptional regulator [Paenibacillus sp. HWE-109]UKS29992.1 helix-turn-helix domain-containing protein [Paenibacillus sp. HWE-109]